MENDNALAELYRQAFAAGQKSLVERLWTGSYFRSWWQDGKPYPDALHADTLYGQLWAFILDLGLTTEAKKLEAHLRSESSINASPYGLKVMRRADPEHPDREDAVPTNPLSEPAPRDNLIWEAGSLDWCSLHLYMGGDMQESLNEANKIVGNWSDRLRDQWNYTDLTTAWDGYPWCNSHYARQVILWSIPLALSGQHYFAAEARLSFDPKVPIPAKLPFFTPACSGALEIVREGTYRLIVHTGTLDVRELRIGKAKTQERILLRAGESKDLLLS